MNHQTYTITRPSRGPTDAQIRAAVWLQQEGEIAFSLRAMAEAQLLAARRVITSKANEA